MGFLQIYVDAKASLFYGVRLKVRFRYVLIIRMILILIQLLLLMLIFLEIENDGSCKRSKSIICLMRVKTSWVGHVNPNTFLACVNVMQLHSLVLL